MNVFPVWIQRAGNSCRVRVSGVENTRWLLAHLSRSFVFKTSEPVREDDTGSHFCIFRVAHSTQIPGSSFERMLTAIPEVQLSLDPASESDAADGLGGYRSRMAPTRS